ncbi:hypothetical protein KR074_010833, partial [Drosophila pseudoananassae]
DLGERLNLLMLCIVCHEVPHPDKSYQCSVGHIVCNDCVSHILADAVISFAEAQCPICRVRLSWNDLAQNAVVRQALWEMSKNCPLCSKLVPLKKLDRHIEKDCQQRKVSCMYRCLGCDWMGVYETCPIHEAGCLFPKMKSEEIQRALEKADRIQRKHQKQAVRFHQELSQRRIFYRNLEFFWKNDWGMTQERFLDSLSFEAYGNHWILRIKIGLSVDDIPVRVGTTLLVQVPPQEVITVRYLVLMPNRQGNDTQMQDILANLIECQVSTSRTMEIYEDLPMQSPMALYRLLAKQRIVLRLWIFM